MSSEASAQVNDRFCRDLETESVSLRIPLVTDAEGLISNLHQEALRVLTSQELCAILPRDQRGPNCLRP